MNDLEVRRSGRSPRLRLGGGRRPRLGLARVRLEARAMARLGDHPGIVTVHDIGEDEGRPYVVSEHMAGGTLAERLPGAAPIAADRAGSLATLRDVADALGGAAVPSPAGATSPQRGEG